MRARTFAFEDNPMPLLKASINASGERKVTVLIDSGAAINLISGEIVSELEEAGIKSSKEGNMRIKVANGKKMLIDRVYNLPIKLGGRVTDSVKFFALENLPFDILIGNPTLREWEAELSWKTHVFSIQPNKSSTDRIQSTWKTFSGQHWRKPIALVTVENTVLEPFSQTRVKVKSGEGDWEARERSVGLITPNRSKQVLTSKFSSAYAIAEETDAVFLANTTSDAITIKKGSQVAEFHPRDESVFTVLPCGENRESEKDRRGGSWLGGDGAPQKERVFDPNSSTNNNKNTNNNNTDNSNNNCNMGISGIKTHDFWSSPQPGLRESLRVIANPEALRVIGNPEALRVIGNPKALRVIGNPRALRVIGNPGETTEGERTTDVNKGEGEGGVAANAIEIERGEIDTERQTSPQGPFDWEQFKHEPLKSVDLTELKKQRTPEEVEKLARVLVKYKHLLSDGTLDFRTNPTVKHSTTCTIRTTEENPKIVARGQRCNPEEAQEFTKQINQKIREGVIEPSCAPWCSNALIIRKDGKIRMVIDYRSLNKVTVKDSYPMPRIQDVTDVLKGTNWFTGIDCVQAFHQIPMSDERSRDLTTFRGPVGGLLRYRYMPYGPCKRNGNLVTIYRHNNGGHV